MYDEAASGDQIKSYVYYGRRSTKMLNYTWKPEFTQKKKREGIKRHVRRA